MVAEFFDIFGFIGFIFITWFAVQLLSKKKPKRWMNIILLIIGVLGLIIDGTIVYMNYLK